MARRVRLRATPPATVQRDVADAGQRAEQQHVEPVDLPELAAQVERGLADQPAVHHRGLPAPGSAGEPATAPTPPLEDMTGTAAGSAPRGGGARDAAPAIAPGIGPGGGPGVGPWATSAPGGSVRRAGSRAERVDHDVARHRGRRRGTGIAMLDHHRDRVARRVIRREGDEQRMRAEFPGQLLAVEIAPLAHARARRRAPGRTRSCRQAAPSDRAAAPAVRCRPARSPPPTCRRAPSADRVAASPGSASPRPAPRVAAPRRGCASDAAAPAARSPPARHRSPAAAASPGCSPGRCRCTTVSPMFQCPPWPMRHSRVGISPVRAPGRSIGKSVPRPNRCAIAAMWSMPVRRAIS